MYGGYGTLGLGQAGITAAEYQRFAALPRIAIPTTTAVARSATIAPAASEGGIAGWWNAASTTEKVAVVGAGVLVVGAVIYLAMPQKAQANPRRRRRHRRVRRHRMR